MMATAAEPAHALRKSANRPIVHLLQEDTIGPKRGGFSAQIGNRVIERVAIGKKPCGAGGGVDESDFFVTARWGLVNSNRGRANGRACRTNHGDVCSASRNKGRDQDCGS